jgi:adenosylhomocysteinase
LSKEYQVRDIALASEGQKKIDWVARPMKVLNVLCEKFLKDDVFRGKKISVCMHLEAKTGYLAIILKKLGADVWVARSNTLSTKDDVCAALAKNGIHVYSIHGANQEEFESFIHAIVEKKPHAVIDDGGDVSEYLHRYPEYGMNLKGICEETTTGVARSRKKYQENQLRYPTMAINDMSFSLQLASLHHILSSENLENKVYQVPVEIDEMVVREKLQVEGIEIERG